MNAKPHLWTTSFIGIVVINAFLFIGNQLQLSTYPLYVHALSDGANELIGISGALSTVAALIVRPFAGYGVDRFGRKIILFIGVAFLLTALLGYTLFSTITIVLILRTIFGFGWGISTTSSNTIAADIIPKSRFGEGMGFFTLSQSFSLALAPMIGLFLFEKFDFNGVAFTSISLLTIVAFIAVSGNYKKPSKKIKKFSPYEKSAYKPSLIMITIGIAISSVFSFIILYGKEMNYAHVGLFFTLYAITLFISRPLLGRAIDHYGYSRVLIPGFIGFIISMALLAFFPSEIVFYMAAMIQGVAYGAVQTSLQTMAVTDAPMERKGAANATFFSGFDIGIGTGSLIAGSLSGLIGYNLMYGFMIIPLVIGLLLYIRLVVIENKKAVVSASNDCTDVG